MKWNSQAVGLPVLIGLPRALMEGRGSEVEVARSAATCGFGDLKFRNLISEG